jgi:hypothetical protein
MQIGSVRQLALIVALSIIVLVASSLRDDTATFDQDVDNSDASSASTSSTHTNEKEKQRLWGSKNNSPEGATESATVSSSSGPAEDSSSSRAQDHEEKQRGEVKDEHGIPFVSKSGSVHHEPPQGFQITSRVYTDPKDKLAHFDNDSAMVFPYWECGTSGSTTVPIPLQHASVRHLLGGSQPTTFSGFEFGPYPQLVVAMTSLDIVLNSGQVQTFHPGDVILLEDVVSCGHKLKGHDNQDMTVMILTLTEHYHQVGKGKTSLQKILTKDNLMKISPCPNGLQFSHVEVEPVGLGNQVGQLLRRLQPRSIRRYLLTVVGLSVSAVVGDFMGKVAPLWLAVLFGGGCFVTGGTLATVKVGDKLLDEFEIRRERRQLRLLGPESETNEFTETNMMEGGDHRNEVPKMANVNR